MPRTELLRRLAHPVPPTPVAFLVLLWTYFRQDKVDLSTAEDRICAAWGRVLDLPERSLSGDDLPAAIRELRASADEAFDELALRLLKGLDTLLNRDPFRDFEGAELSGVDGELYTVHSRNPFLASRWDVTWERHQGLSLAAYCSHFMVVPSYPIQGIRIETCTNSSWRNAYLQDRLHDERGRLRIMLWPFECTLDYPAFEEMKKKPPPERVRLDTLGNEPVLQEEVRRALAEALRLQVTLLILPELSIPPRTEAMLREHLAKQGMGKYPVLTIFGCSHRRHDPDGRDINEAILLGPDGSELHRHRKLFPFTKYSEGEKHRCGERLKTGTTVTVLECSFGNITPLICIDLLNTKVKDILSRSHANLFAVPSLSPKTSAHQGAAKELQPRLLSCTFVCNHWNDDPPAHRSTSFYHLPAPEGLRLHVDPITGKADLPYLLFDLAKTGT
jgi:hypothetical protein